MRLAGLAAIGLAAAAAAVAAPRAPASGACARSPDAEQYPLLARYGALHAVYGARGEGSYCFPWGLCPDHPLALTRRDLPAAGRALRAALPVILGRPQAVRSLTFPPTGVDRELILRHCIGGDANAFERTVIAVVAGETYYVSKLAKGWVVWHRLG